MQRLHKVTQRVKVLLESAKGFQDSGSPRPGAVRHVKFQAIRCQARLEFVGERVEQFWGRCQVSARIGEGLLELFTLQSDALGRIQLFRRLGRGYPLLRRKWCRRARWFCLRRGLGSRRARDRKRTRVATNGFGGDPPLFWLPLVHATAAIAVAVAKAIAALFPCDGGRGGRGSVLFRPPLDVLRKVGVVRPVAWKLLLPRRLVDLIFGVCALPCRLPREKGFSR